MATRRVHRSWCGCSSTPAMRRCATSAPRWVAVIWQRSVTRRTRSRARARAFAPNPRAQQPPNWKRLRAPAAPTPGPPIGYVNWKSAYGGKPAGRWNTCAPARSESATPALTISRQASNFHRLGCSLGLGGRVVMQRPAKPCTPVRFRPEPPTPPVALRARACADALRSAARDDDGRRTSYSCARFVNMGALDVRRCLEPGGCACCEFAEFVRSAPRGSAPGLLVSGGLVGGIEDGQGARPPLRGRTHRDLPRQERSGVRVGGSLRASSGAAASGGGRWR